MRRQRLEGRAALVAFLLIVGLVCAAALVYIAVDSGRDGDGTARGSPATEAAKAEETLIVFGSRGDLYRVPSGGGPVRPLAKGGGKDRSPEWSPDGRLLAFTREHDVVILDPADGHVAGVTGGPWRDGSPAWSPDGTQIALDRRRGDSGPFDIWVVKVVGDGIVNLTPGRGPSATAPEWSADGKQILFQREQTLWVMNADGSAPRRLLPPSPEIELSPAASPDGEWIAYAGFSTDQRESDIYVASANGRTRRNVTRGRADAPNWPAWSSDGERLVFADRRGVWIVGADGRGLRRLARGGPYGSPTWAPGA